MLRFSKPFSVLVLMGLVVGVACRRSVPNPVTATVVKQTPIAATTPKREESALSSLETKPTGQSPQPAAESPEAVTEAETASQTLVVPVSSERVLLIAPGGPIIVE